MLLTCVEIFSDFPEFPFRVLVGFGIFESNLKTNNNIINNKKVGWNFISFSHSKSMTFVGRKMKYVPKTEI